MADLLQIASTFAAGAAGAASMVKLMKMMAARKAEPERKRINSLFPNGEKLDIIERIDDLTLRDRERHKELHELSSSVERIARALGIPL